MQVLNYFLHIHKVVQDTSLLDESNLVIRDQIIQLRANSLVMSLAKV
jgi:hypothetical protein